MNNISLLTITLFALLSTPLLAEEKPSQKLPFIGERIFNFYGGAGTGEYIKIKKNGDTILGGCGDGMDAKCIDSYKGKYSNPLPAGDDKGGKYLINENKIYYLKKNDEGNDRLHE